MLLLLYQYRKFHKFTFSYIQPDRTHIDSTTTAELIACLVTRFKPKSEFLEDL